MTAQLGVAVALLICIQEVSQVILTEEFNDLAQFMQ
jgi:hypothetical protein